MSSKCRSICLGTKTRASSFLRCFQSSNAFLQRIIYILLVFTQMKISKSLFSKEKKSVKNPPRSLQNEEPVSLELDSIKHSINESVNDVFDFVRLEDGLFSLIYQLFTYFHSFFKEMSKSKPLKVVFHSLSTRPRRRKAVVQV